MQTDTDFFNLLHHYYTQIIFSIKKNALVFSLASAANSDCDRIISPFLFPKYYWHLLPPPLCSCVNGGWRGWGVGMQHFIKVISIKVILLGKTHTSRCKTTNCCTPVTKAKTAHQYNHFFNS